MISENDIFFYEIKRDGITSFMDFMKCNCTETAWVARASIDLFLAYNMAWEDRAKHSWLPIVGGLALFLLLKTRCNKVFCPMSPIKQKFWLVDIKSTYHDVCQLKMCVPVKSVFNLSIISKFTAFNDFTMARFSWFLLRSSYRDIPWVAYIFLRAWIKLALIFLTFHINLILIFFIRID